MGKRTIYATEVQSIIMNRAVKPIQPIACHQCRHYFVTWDVHFPHGCRAHGFKSKKSPAQEVYEASGMQCLLFSSKKSRAVESDEER
jgi:hypothetical protein